MLQLVQRIQTLFSLPSTKRSNSPRDRTGIFLISDSIPGATEALKDQVTGLLLELKVHRYGAAKHIGKPIASPAEKSDLRILYINREIRAT